MNHISKYSLFENNDEQLSEADIRSYLDEGRLFVAKQAREKALYTEALKLLNLVHTAEASFQTALVYFLLKRLLVLSSLCEFRRLQCTVVLSAVDVVRNALEP